MIIDPIRRPILTIITVVYNDASGLASTMDSVLIQCSDRESFEYIVVDGSSTSDTSKVLDAYRGAGVKVVAELDDGLYDAMNKGFKHASGRYVLFINAGDRLHQGFRPACFIASARTPGVLVGRCIERFRCDAYLRPKRSRHDRQQALSNPAHPATFYPRIGYIKMRFNTNMPIKADGDLTKRMIAEIGGEFIDDIVSEFELGGRSSRYGSMEELKARLRQSSSGKEALSLLLKAVLWRVVSQRLFYRILAMSKYDRLPPAS